MPANLFPSGSESKESAAMPETWVRFLGGKGPLEKEMATHFSIFPWGIPWTEEPGGVHGVTKSQTRLSDFTLMIQGKFEQIVNVKTWDRYLGYVWYKSMEDGIKLDFKWS